MSKKYYSFVALLAAAGLTAAVDASADARVEDALALELASALANCGEALTRAAEEAGTSVAVTSARKLPGSSPALPSWAIRLSRLVIAPDDANYREDFKVLRVTRKRTRAGTQAVCELEPV